MKARILAEPGEFHKITQDFHYAGLRNGTLTAAAGDWAVNLTGHLYRDDETAFMLDMPQETEYNGGVIGATTVCNQIIRNIARDPPLTGIPLVEDLNRALANKYARLGINGYEDRRRRTFLGYIAHILVNPDIMNITAVGDVCVAADGQKIAGRTKRVDIVHPRLRAMYVKRTEDVDGGFDHVRPWIDAQTRFQNTPGSKNSFPAVDGTKTQPESEIELIQAKTPGRLLIWTDTYVDPTDFTIEGLERMLEHVYDVDPHRFKRYPAVGYNVGDRTAIEIDIDGDWDKLTIESVEPIFFREK
ncbi:hypothetical protein ACFLQN_00270 [Candidatus Aenigmatarchaeota archaeon]